MEDSPYEVLDFRVERPKRSFLLRKISLTIPVCVLLIAVFLLSALVITIVSFYWIDGTICHVDDQQLITEPRSKRSLALKKTNSLCVSALCCSGTHGPIVPWTETRLPTNLYPVDYQLTLALYQLNQTNDQYKGTVDIVIDVRSPTNEIVLHTDVDVYVSDIIVSQRSNPNDVNLTVDCALPGQNTQTLRIFLWEQLQVGFTYDVRISFNRSLSIHGTGIFENQFNKNQFGNSLSRIILTHFKPVHAREAFPCFDEPGFKAKFQLTVYHENNTRVVSNWDESESFWDGDRYITEFYTVPDIPTASIAFSIFYIDDFDHRTVDVRHPISNRIIHITLWARRIFFNYNNAIQVNAPLDMMQKIFTALLNIFQEITVPVVPNKIDVLAIPEYPSDVVSHWGLIICTERSFLHDPSTTSELDHQRIALLIAKAFAEQWYGNFVSFRWWTDLWLQEALVNYLKYHAVEAAYPEWAIHDQFTVGELLPTMSLDSMSTSHPVYKSVTTATQIDELFDSIETTKSTAILRMADYYMKEFTGIANNTLSNIVSFLHEREYGFIIPDELLSKYQIGPWNGLDFFDRWLYQSNFPKISAYFISDGSENIFHLEQRRFRSLETYDYDLYPSDTNPFRYIWYVPIHCRFSNDPNRFQMNLTFHLDQQQMNVSFGTESYTYYYCNADFAGYYIMDYTDDNWQGLAQALDNHNGQLTDLDRANLLNNALISAQTTDESYLVVRELTQFFYRPVYTGLLAWQTLSYHVNRMLDLLEYESLYIPVQKYFQLVVRGYYRTYEANLWNDNGTFSEGILKNIIIQMACRLRLPDCINQVTLLWQEAFPILDSGSSNHSIVDHARTIVYQTHFQNTYDDGEWIAIESDYHNFADVQERYRLLQALTQSRQTWHLYQFLYRDVQMNKDRDMDILEVLTLLAKNPTSRELVWSYYRDNWARLQLDYERTNQRLGQLLIDITSTFEDQFHQNELLDFLVYTTGVSANVDARYWSLERATINYWWVINKATDISNSFDLEI